MHYSLLNQPLTVLYTTIFDRWYPFDTPGLEHCISFNCYKICTVLKYEINPKPGNVLDFFIAINFTINPFNPFIQANLCWRHCLHFNLCYAIYAIFSSKQAILKEISVHQQLRNYWVAKKLMSHTIFVKVRVFQSKSLQKHLVYPAQIFRDN